MLRNISGEAASFADLKLQLLDVEISSLRIGVRSSIAGKSLSQIELRKRSGITVLAIRQNSKILSNPDGDIQLYANDVLFVLGPPEKVAGAMGLFHNPGMD
ncbi:MAG: TrkA C-terminal domain-containing protein [Deltaproteobacteria bacterium]|nr:TrkA C-terminal domain-containing protein [Deltaproteobacteria bacterium]